MRSGTSYDNIRKPSPFNSMLTLCGTTLMPPAFSLYQEDWESFKQDHFNHRSQKHSNGHNIFIQSRDPCKEYFVSMAKFLIDSLLGSHPEILQNSFRLK